MNYYKRLSFFLRQRRVSEDQIVAILDDVSDVVRGSGELPEHEFGSPQKYAGSFPKGTTRSLGSRITLAGFVVLALAIVGDVTVRALQDRNVGYLLGTPAFVFVLGAFLLIIVAGMALDFRLPAGFRRMAGDREGRAEGA